MKIILKKQNWIASLLCATIFILSGCANDNVDDLKEYVTKVNERKPRAIEPLPEIKAYETFIYNMESLRNPFQKLEEPEVLSEAGDAAIQGPGPDLDREKEDLEAYPLDTLRMVGTLSLNGKLWGLIRAGDGVIHRVLPGNFMGQNYGKIVSLDEELIELDEFITTGKGRWRERKASLAIVE